MNRIKEIRQRLGLSQEEFGKGIGCSQGNVGFIERGEQELKPDRARRLVEFARARGHELTLDHVYGLATLPGVAGSGEGAQRAHDASFADMPPEVQRRKVAGAG